MNREEQQSTALSTEVRRPRRGRGVVLTALREGLLRRRERNAEILFDLFVGGVAFLFAVCHAAFGVYPFSLALLLSTSGRVIPVFIGAAVGCTFLGDAGVLYLVLHMLALLFRLWTSYPRRRRALPESPALFEEEPALRALGGVFLGTLMALYELILFGLERYTLLFAAGALFLPPICTLLFTFCGAQRRSLRAILGKELPTPSRYFGTKAPFLFSLGGVFFLFVFALSLGRYSFFGISLSGCAITAATLFVSRRYGAARGCAAGLIVALAGTPLYLPTYGILGLLSGLYGGLGMPLSLGAAVVSGGGYAAYVGGLSGFLAVMPEMAITSLLLWMPLRHVSAVCEPLPPLPKEPREKKRDAGESIACLSGALSAVSEELKEAAKRERTPTPEEYDAICSAVKERICRRCPAEGACGEGAAVREGLHAAVIRFALGEGIPDGALGVCEGYGKMLEEIRREMSSFGQRKRQGGAKGALSADYALLSEMLAELSERERTGDGHDEETERALKEALAGYGIAAEEISVVGKRRRRIVLTGLHGEEGKRVEGEWVEDACVRVCGRSVTGLRFSYEDGRLCARTSGRRIFSADGGVYTLAGKEGECAADAAATVESEEGFVYALLSDGMGSGTRAASAASLSVSVLKLLLSAGVSRQVALAVINNLICAAEEECSVALDLLSLDLYEGRASFLKSGAAASFVYRDGALFRIRSRTIPLGLLRIVDSEEACFDVRDGDILVLLSDGVLGEAEDGGRLKELLSTRTDGATLAKMIVTEAERRCASADDKTALVLKISAVRAK